MRILFYLCFFLISAPVFANGGLAELVQNNPVIVSGKLVACTRVQTADSGQIAFAFKVKADTILKQNQFLSQEFTFYGTPSSFSTSFGDIPEQYRKKIGKKFIFFLSDLHLQADAFPITGAQRFYPWTHESEQKTASECQKLRINPFPEKETEGDREFCKWVREGDWFRVGQKVDHFIHPLRKEGYTGALKSLTEYLEEQPCVTEIIPPMAILSSLPSWYDLGVNFKTPNGIEEKVMTFQIGRVMFFGRFSQVDYVKFVGIGDAGNRTASILEAERLNWLNHIADTVGALPQAYLPESEDFLRSYLDPGEDMYGMSCTYHSQEQSLELLKKMEEKGQALDICLVTMHCRMELRLEALRALARMDDPRTLPYLLRLAKFEINRGKDDPEAAKIHGQFCDQLLQTLNSLTNCKVFPAHGHLQPADALSLGYPVWCSKVVGF